MAVVQDEQKRSSGRRFRYARPVGSCRRWAVALIVLAYAAVLAVLLTPRAALAASEDAAVQQAVKQVFDEEYSSGAFGPALTKLNAALNKCKKGCSGATKGQVYVALGMVASQVGKADDARNDFATALGVDPNAALPDRGVTPNIKGQWDDAKQLVQNTAPATDKPADAREEASPPPPAAPAQENADVKQEHAIAPADPSKRKIPGWENVDAFQQASAGLAADMAGKLEQCIEYDNESLKLEEQPRTRLHLWSCERRSGKLIDALRDAQKALESGIAKKDVAVMKAARMRVQDLLLRIPHVTFQPPPGATDVQVTFDERDVPTESLTKKFSVDPGEHSVHAEGTLNGGVPLTFDQKYTVNEGELLTVKVALSSPPSEYLTPGQLRCMLQAKSQEDVLKCLPQKGKNIVVKAGFDMAGYADTTHVYVASPSINGSVSSPTAGWNIGGSFIVDIVTAASPDIVSEASSHYKEKRYAGTLSGGYKPGLYGAEASANFSDEPDYLSIGGGLALTADLNDKLTTPRVAINRSHDDIGRGPNNVVSHLDTTEAEAGVTMVLSSTTLMTATGTGQFERGDQSKPYRYVPMFDPTAVAPFIPPGASIDLVNRYRLNVRPLEQLPTARDRYAVGIRLSHRFSSTTLRIDQRVYYDSWQLKATTTDMRYVVDVSKRLRLWPHGRLNAQTGANFYRLAYGATVSPTQGVTVPLFRTDDRELSPLVTLTGGGGMRLGLNAPESKTQWGLNVSGDVMYTKYFDALFITFRTAVFGAIGLDAEFE